MADKSARDPVILASARTAQGKFLGSLTPVSAVELGAAAFKAAVERSGVDAQQIDEVLVGNVVGAGVGQALPRQISLAAGIPDSVGGTVVNKVCGSSLKAVMMAAGAIKAGDGKLYAAGGVESMSRAPYLNDSIRQGNKYGAVQVRDALQVDGLWCSIVDWGMGNAAEFIARQFEITRDEMDAFAARSHQLAAQATDSGTFKAEITPILLKSRSGETRFEVDEAIRRDTSVEALAKLKPAFEADGAVTAGNAPGMNDGAAAVIVSSRAYAEEHQHPSVARIAGYAQAAVDPRWIFYAPVKAIPLALERAGWRFDEVDLFEVNEAFAAQVLADLEGLKRDGHSLPQEKLNVNGGAIALGHPLGASGARILTTLIHALRDRGLKRGVAALCLGGGEAVALAVEVE
ncbi:MAG: acetyl-CoA C-acyltransferase [Anaerolineae bacterium]|nr:acetyl-CoA C-acyltransferase [Anaerolineae bacterium]